MTLTGLVERLDAHNPSCDDVLARAGRCGMIHLASGRRCPRPIRHRGCCTFVAADGGRDGPVPVDPQHVAVTESLRLGCVLGL